MAESAPCGTEAAYRAHLANREKCQTCTNAHNDRARQDDRKRARSRAQSRALNRLARAFPIEYNALYQQELAKETADAR